MRGISQLSSNKIIAARARATAMPTYIGSSFSHRSLRSVTRADMPATKHCFPQMPRISRMASMVRSSDVDVSKKTAIIVELSVLKAL